MKNKINVLGLGPGNLDYTLPVVLKEIEKGINNVKNSEIGQQAMEEGGKLWDSLMKKVDEIQKK